MKTDVAKFSTIARGELFEKKIIIFEHVHVELIKIIAIIKITIIQLQEEYKNPDPPPDQTVIDQVTALTSQLETTKARWTRSSVRYGR